MVAFNPIEAAVEIMAAFVSYNSVPVGEVPNLIELVHSVFIGFAEPGNRVTAAADLPASAVSIRKSVTPDYLICLDDGKAYKSLRRHVALLGMTPEQYREKWRLPLDYPMVAANYSAKRSAMAKSFGFGANRKKRVVAPVLAPAKRKFDRLPKGPA